MNIKHFLKKLNILWIKLVQMMSQKMIEMIISLNKSQLLHHQDKNQVLNIVLLRIKDQLQWILNCQQKDLKDLFHKINIYQLNPQINKQEEEDLNHMSQKNMIKDLLNNKLLIKHKIHLTNLDLKTHINHLKLQADMDKILSKILMIINYCHLNLNTQIKEEEFLHQKNNSHKVSLTSKIQKIIQYPSERIKFHRDQLNKILKENSQQRITEKIQSLNRTDLNNQINGMILNLSSF